MAVFETNVSVQSSLDDAFELLIKPQTLAEISPPAAQITIVKAPERFENGSQFEFTLGGFGLPQRMIHEIFDVLPPSGFSERVIKSPIKQWVHEHIFEPAGDGVVIIDRITFEPPGGIIGFMLTEEKILQSLEGGFVHRHAALKRLLQTKS